MKTWSHGMFVVLATLAAPAAADDEVRKPDVSRGETFVAELGSKRGVADNYLVLPSGGELSGQMRFLVAQPVFSDERVRFSDLALFGLGGRWSILPRLEISATVDLLAKQPSYTDEKPWQSVGVGLRTPIANHVAVSLSGAGGHLIDHSGMWTKQALAVQWRKPVMDLVRFDLTATVDSVQLTAPDAPSAVIGEVGVGANVLFRAPRVWGGWVGLGYAIPVIARGSDPTTGMAVDPQPRLDLRVGTALSISQEWDLYAELAVVDRGDLSVPSTRLPIIDGGFDQQQIVLGVVRHFESTRPPRRAPMIIGAR